MAEHPDDGAGPALWVEWDCEGNTFSARYTDEDEARARLAALATDPFVSHVHLVP